MHRVGLLLMPHRTVSTHDQAHLVAVGLWAVALGVLMALDGSANDELWLPMAWPALLIGAGICALAWAARPSSEQLRSLSGAALVAGLTGRGVALIHGVLVGTSEVSLARVLVGIALWSMLAYVMNLLWRRLLPAPRGH